MNAPKKVRLVVEMPETTHRKLKAKLAAQGKTISSWVREKAKAHIGALVLAALLLSGCKLEVTLVTDDAPRPAAPVVQQLERTGPAIERTETYGRVPPGWTVTGSQTINGYTKHFIERPRP